MHTMSLLKYAKVAKMCNQSNQGKSFLTKQGLLQNVRFIFDTTVEDILLSRDCEVTKQGKRQICFECLKVFKPAITLKFLRSVGTISICVIFINQMISQNNYICKTDTLQMWLGNCFTCDPPMHGICVLLSINHSNFPGKQFSILG